MPNAHQWTGMRTYKKKAAGYLAKKQILPGSSLSQAERLSKQGLACLHQEHLLHGSLTLMLTAAHVWAVLCTLNTD